MNDLFLVTQFHPNFSLDVLCHSDTADKHNLRNACPEELLPNLLKLSKLLGDIERLFPGHRLVIHSGYRSPELNKLVGGTATSQHCQGLAADFSCPSFGSPREIAKRIAHSSLNYDQLILEFDRWVHVSTTKENTEPRNQVLSINSTATGYQTGIV